MAALSPDGHLCGGEIRQAIAMLTKAGMIWREREAASSVLCFPVAETDPLIADPLVAD